MENDSKVFGNENESNSGSLEDILQLSNRSHSARDRFKMCCRPYRIRRLKNKGALLILIWNHLVLSVFHYLILNPYVLHPSWHYITYNIIWGLTLPVTGWLADVYLRRYKVICWSIFIMWIASVLVVASSVLSQFVESYYSINYYVTAVLLIIICIAFGGYQANIVLFGIDQLQDASTDEITSFISWYICTWFSSVAIDYFIDMYLSGKYGMLLQKFVVCICLTLMVILATAFNRVFLKEPITQNPFQLIYKVIKYAIKTKHPKCRSAFTYCEDKLPSRIDFGKCKYGGPFTTEEVENVKTFLRLLVVILVSSAVSSGIFSINTGYKLFLKQDTFYFREFLKSSWIATKGPVYFGAAVLVAIYEFIFYPLLRRSLSCIQSYHWKLYVGVVSQMARVIALMVVDITARYNYNEHNNSTIQCIFVAESGMILSSNFNMKWMILPSLLNSVSLIALITGAFELICSQSPYSMRGLLSGAMYGCVMLYGVIGYGVLKPFTKYSKQVWGTGIISCEF